MKRDILDRLLAAKAAAVPAALVTDLNSGLQTLVFEDAVHGGFGLEPDLLDEVRRRIRQDRSGLLVDPQDEDGFRLFVHVHNPAMRLLIVGAVHIAQALAPVAALTGYDVTVIDPKAKWTIDKNASKSKSRNTPFHGWKVTGRAVATIVGGEVKKNELA